MSFQTEDPSAPFSGTRRGWWLQQIVDAAGLLSFFGGIFTILCIVQILYCIDIKAHHHAKFSIQSISVDDSSATWHVDFLVKNPSSRYSIYYDAEYAEVKLGQTNAAVLSISHKRSSRDLTAFSLAFVAEGNQNDVVYEQLDIKLGGKHNGFLTYLLGKEAGYFNIICRNLTRSHENIKNMKCQLSFSHLQLFIS